MYLLLQNRKKLEPSEIGTFRSDLHLQSLPAIQGGKGVSRFTIVSPPKKKKRTKKNSLGTKIFAPLSRMSNKLNE